MRRTVKWRKRKCAMSRERCRRSDDEKCDDRWCDASRCWCAGVGLDADSVTERGRAIGSVGAEVRKRERCRVVRTVVGLAVSEKTKGRDEYANEGVGGCCCCRGGHAKDRVLGWCARARGFTTEARFWQLKARVKRGRVRPRQVKRCQSKQGITRNGFVIESLPTPTYRLHQLRLDHIRAYHCRAPMFSIQRSQQQSKLPRRAN
jgi:hypothetical protein